MVGTRSVLVVVDDDSCRETYAEWLVDEYHVLVAIDEADARRKLHRTVDVVLVSDGLVGEGLSVETIRRETRGCHVVALTPLSDTRGPSRDAFDDSLAKPTTRTELQSTIERYLVRSAYDRTLRSFYSLASMKVELESELDRDRLAESQGYTRICRRVAELRRELADAVERTETDWADMFEVCHASAGTDESQPVA